MVDIDKLHRHALELTELTSPSEIAASGQDPRWALKVAREWHAIASMWEGEPVQVAPRIAVVPELPKRLPVTLPDDLFNEDDFQR